MGLARSTYYDEPEIQPIDEARLVEQIKEVCAEWPAYGYRRVTAELHGEGRIVNHKKDGGGPGPKMEERVDPEKVIRDARDAGLELRKRENFLRYHYLLTFGVAPK